MLISEKYNFIFIHIQKTGGTSFMELLANEVSDLRPLCFKHDGANEGITELGRKEWDRYFKFAIVRNPWDRLVSWYSMIENTPERTTKLREYARNNSSNFTEFISNCTKEIVDTDGIQSFAKNQIDYLTDSKGNMVVDYIGRFENLNKEFNYFRDKIKLNKSLTLPHINHNSKHKHYSSYYGEKTKEIIAKRYKKDIDYFNYTFQKSTFLEEIKNIIQNKNKDKRDINVSINYMEAKKKEGF